MAVAFFTFLTLIAVAVAFAVFRWPLCCRSPERRRPRTCTRAFRPDLAIGVRTGVRRSSAAGTERVFKNQ